jgi:hypothetical protein
LVFLLTPCIIPCIINVMNFILTLLCLSLSWELSCLRIFTPYKNIIIRSVLNASYYSCSLKASLILRIKLYLIHSSLYPDRTFHGSYSQSNCDFLCFFYYVDGLPSLHPLCRWLFLLVLVHRLLLHQCLLRCQAPIFQFLNQHTCFSP